MNLTVRISSSFSPSTPLAAPEAALIRPVHSHVVPSRAHSANLRSKPGRSSGTIRPNTTSGLPPPTMSAGASPSNRRLYADTYVKDDVPSGLMRYVKAMPGRLSNSASAEVSPALAPLAPPAPAPPPVQSSSLRRLAPPALLMPPSIVDVSKLTTRTEGLSRDHTMQCNMECNSTDVMGMQLKRDIDRTIMYHHDHGGYLTAFDCNLHILAVRRIQNPESPKVKAKVKREARFNLTKRTQTRSLIY